LPTSLATFLIALLHQYAFWLPETSFPLCLDIASAKADLIAAVMAALMTSVVTLSTIWPTGVGQSLPHELQISTGQSLPHELQISTGQSLHMSYRFRPDNLQLQLSRQMQNSTIFCIRPSFFQRRHVLLIAVLHRFRGSIFSIADSLPRLHVDVHFEL